MLFIKWLINSHQPINWLIVTLIVLEVNAQAYWTDGLFVWIIWLSPVIISSVNFSLSLCVDEVFAEYYGCCVHTDVITYPKNERSYNQKAPPQFSHPQKQAASLILWCHLLAILVMKSLFFPQVASNFIYSYRLTLFLFTYLFHF